MVINQFHANGDIIFIEPILRHFYKKNGVKPLLPVRDHLMYLSEYIESAEFIPMSQYKGNLDLMEITDDYLPLRFANQIIRNLKSDDHSDFSNTMPDKYFLAGIHLDEWTKIDLKFNTQRGIKLFEKLNLEIGDEYILINEYCQIGKIDINVESNYKKIYMENIPGFTLIDWYFIILNSIEVHSVSTSTFFLFQAIRNKYPFYSKVFIYPRPNEDGTQGISKLIPTFNLTIVKW